MLATTTHRGLSNNEMELLHLLAAGLSNDAIARAVCLSPKTIEGRLTNLYTKLGVPADPAINRRVTAVLALLMG